MKGTWIATGVGAGGAVVVVGRGGVVAVAVAVAVAGGRVGSGAGAPVVIGSRVARGAGGETTGSGKGGGSCSFEQPSCATSNPSIIHRASMAPNSLLYAVSNRG